MRKIRSGTTVKNPSKYSKNKTHPRTLLLHILHHATPNIINIIIYNYSIQFISHPTIGFLLWFKLFFSEN